MPHTVIEQHEYFNRALILRDAWERILCLAATQVHDMRRGNATLITVIPQSSNLYLRPRRYTAYTVRLFLLLKQFYIEHSSGRIGDDTTHSGVVLYVHLRFHWAFWPGPTVIRVDGNWCMRNYGWGCYAGLKLCRETAWHVPAECGQKTHGKKRLRPQTWNRYCRGMLVQDTLKIPSTYHSSFKSHNTDCNVQGGYKD